MITENKIILFAEEYMDTNCMIFTKEQYRSFLKIMLNDPKFVLRISSLSARGKMDAIREIEDYWGLDLSDTISFLQNQMDEEDSLSGIRDISSELELLKRSFLEARTSEAFTKIKENLARLEDCYHALDTKNSNAAVMTSYDELTSAFLSFRTELDSVLSSFMTDEAYSDLMEKKFLHNRIWSTPYGTYQYNTYFDTDAGRSEDGMQFEPFAKCTRIEASSRLWPTYTAFCPLVLENDIYISTDGCSISCFSNPRTLKYRIDLKDFIIGPGTVLYLRNARCIAICCKKAIKVINENGIVWTHEYKNEITDAMELKSMCSYNNMIYVNFTDKRDDTSLVYLVRYDFYQKRFSCRPPVTLKDRIMGNILVWYDYESEEARVTYITKGQNCVIADSQSLDVIRSFKVDALPLDSFCKSPKGTSLDYYFPLTLHDGVVYYDGLDKNDRFSLYAVSLTSGECVKTEQAPIYEKKNGMVIPWHTNVSVGNNLAVTDGSFKGTTSYVSLDGRHPVREESDKNPGKWNTLLVRYKDQAFSLDASDPQGMVKRMRIVAVWGGRLVTCLDVAGGYELYLEK